MDVILEMMKEDGCGVGVMKEVQRGGRSDGESREVDYHVPSGLGYLGGTRDIELFKYCC